MTVTVLIGDVRDRLRELPDESVHCVVTSPPYWGLRDYGHAGQIGLEDSPDAFVAALVGVMREVRRVLRADGTAWVNLGDSYAAAPVGSFNGGGFKDSSALAGTRDLSGVATSGRMDKLKASGLKMKDLCGIPWRVAFALQADGWWLRQDIIWHKPNPMPESVRDRCTKAHEYIFLLAKSERYYYDLDAISEECSPNTHERYAAAKGKEFGMSNWARGEGPHDPVSRSRDVGVGRNARPRKAAQNGVGIKNNESFDRAMAVMPDRRNKRSVWSVVTEAFPEAHFATFPPALIEPCILAGCPKDGTVLDPFGGAGTTGLVADRLQRNAILIELNPDYAAMAERRIRGESPMFADVRVA